MNRPAMNRRQLLVRIVQGFGIVGVGLFLVPLLRAWLPKFDRDIFQDVDLADLRPGQVLRLPWQGRTVLVLRRSRAMLQRLIAGDIHALADPDSAHSLQPSFARGPTRSLRDEILVVYVNCTHLGCEIEFQPGLQAGIGFVCPCHRSDFDLAGRVFAGQPAQRNLDVPHYRFVARNLLRLEEA